MALILLLGGLSVAVVLVAVFLVFLIRKATAAAPSAGVDGGALPNGERPVHGPERAAFSGGPGAAQVRGTGTLTLFDSRLHWKPLLGGPIEIPLSSIQSVRADRHFRGEMGGGNMHLIVQTNEGEYGFAVQHHEGWTAALTPRIGRGG
jgi:hypothetical protein